VRVDVAGIDNEPTAATGGGVVYTDWRWGRYLAMWAPRAALMGAAVWACGAIPLWAMTRAASIPGVWWIVVAAVLLVLVAAFVVNAGRHRRSHAPIELG
jgi:hypothetical protein